MSGFIFSLLDFIFPTECIICNTEGPDICPKCQAGFESAKPGNYDWIASLWNYRDGNVEKLMRHIKNNPNKRLARILAREMAKRFARERSERADSPFLAMKNPLVIPIPIGRARWRSRGYNQSQLLARPLATLLKKTLAPDILIKSKQTKKQGTTKSRAERLDNIAGSFTVQNAQKIRNRDIIIIDDITTTGTTLIEARKVLLAAGAKNVAAVTVAN